MTKYYSIIIMLFLIIGCKDSSINNSNEISEDPFSSLPKDSVIVSSTPLNSKIVFSFTEDITISGRPFELTFNTVELYGGGRNIAGKITRNGMHIGVQLDSITTNGGGPGISLPGTIRFKLGGVSNGLYDFTITVNSKNIQALMLVTDSAYTIKIQSNNFVSTSRPQLLRVSKNIIFGQSESYNSTIYREFLDSLVVAGAKPAHLPVGDYIFFNIISPDSFYIPSTIGRSYGEHFIYQFDLDTLISRNLVQRYAKRYGDSIYVELLGGRGELYLSTILRWEP